jgi:hypothetical protein
MRLVILMMVLLSGCASYAGAQWNTDLRGHDGRLVTISGKPVFGGESRMSICPPEYLGAGLTNCLDVVAPDRLIADLRGTSPNCLVVSGRYSAFGPNRISIGNLRSNVGYIEAAHVDPCHGR